MVLPFAKPRGARYRLFGGDWRRPDPPHVPRHAQALRAAGCSDLINGGTGTDQAASATTSARVSLVTGRATYEGGSRGTLRGIEDVAGSLGSDVLIGDAGPNVLRGRYGKTSSSGVAVATTRVAAGVSDTCRAEVTAGCER